MIWQIPITAISRKFEYAADAFEVQHTSKETAISALKKLYRAEYGNLTPHPFVVMMRFTHPPLTQRIAAIERVENVEVA